MIRHAYNKNKVSFNNTISVTGGGGHTPSFPILCINLFQPKSSKVPFYTILPRCPWTTFSHQHLGIVSRRMTWPYNRQQLCINIYSILTTKTDMVSMRSLETLSISFTPHIILIIWRSRSNRSQKFFKIDVLKKLQYSQKNNCVAVSF